ncbi:MAG: nucleotidyltransferase domain-containing protein [Saprospiraceae bacterium]
MKVLEKYTTEIKQLCKNYKVKKLYAFGSVLTNKFNEKSDIDLVVEFNNIAINEYADNYFNFKFSLEDILKRPLDLLEENAISNPYLKESLLKQRQLVYGE